MKMSSLVENKDIEQFCVWVGGIDDYYETYASAEKAYNRWCNRGYDDVALELIFEDGSRITMWSSKMREITSDNFWQDFEKDQPSSTVDELNCDNCGDWIGFESDGGYRTFWINDQTKAMVCDFCYEEEYGA